MFSLEQRMLGLLSVCINTRGGDYGRQTQTLLSDRTRVSGHKLKYRQFCLKVRNKNITFFFVLRMVEHENKLSGQAVDIQNRSGHGPEQDNLALSRGIGVDGLWRNLSGSSIV